MIPNVLALSGGVGGARLAVGLAEMLAPDELTIVANTGDDFEHFGLLISPDLDTVMYSLSGFVIDEVDAAQADEVRALGIEVLVAPTIMHTRADKVELTRRVLAFADRLSWRT